MCNVCPVLFSRVEEFSAAQLLNHSVTHNPLIEVETHLVRSLRFGGRLP